MGGHEVGKQVANASALTGWQLTQRKKNATKIFLFLALTSATSAVARSLLDPTHAPCVKKHYESATSLTTAASTGHMIGMRYAEGRLAMELLWLSPSRLCARLR